MVLKLRDEFAPYPTNQVLLNANNIQAFNFGNLEGNAYICAGMAHSPITWWSCGYMERRDQPLTYPSIVS